VPIPGPDPSDIQLAEREVSCVTLADHLYQRLESESGVLSEAGVGA
jgi:hypothetical protein